MAERVYVVGHKNPDTDSVCSAIAFSYLLNQWRANGGFMEFRDEAIPIMQGELNPETEYVLERFEVESPEISTNVGGKVALVDHSEKAQSLDNIEDVEIVAIVDHHKIGNITTPNPILYVNIPVGCTCTVLKRLYDWSGINVPKEIAGLMLSAILSDTVIFRSPTTTEMDKKVAKELAKIVGIEDIVKFGIDIKAKLSDVSKLSAREIIMRDFKDYDMFGKKIGIGQIEIVDIKLIRDRVEEIYEEMKKIKEEGGYFGIFMMLTDIMREGTELLVIIDNPKVVEIAFNKKLEDKSVWLEGVMSRKKQVVPNLLKTFEQLHKKAVTPFLK